MTWVSSPRLPDSWEADRPGDFPRDGQPEGQQLGSPGPDLGYAYKLVELFHGKLHLEDGENAEDAETGCTVVAMKRASLFGRAPVVHDLRVAFTVWGFLDDAPAKELVDVRRRMFENVSMKHYYPEQRAIADAVPAEALRRTPDEVAKLHESDWRSLLSI